VSVNISGDRRPRVPITTTYKIILTGPDGKVLKVIEGKNDDPFTYSFAWLFYTLMVAPSQSNDIPDVAGTELFLFTPSVPTDYTGPAVAIPYPAAALCLVNCPGTPNVTYTLKLPGIWLFSTPFSVQPMVSNIYSSLITSVAYSPPSVSENITATVGATNTITLSQTIINNTGSTITVASFAVVAALYPVTSSGLSGTPYFIDIAYYNLPTPLTWSPGIALNVQVSFVVPT
jgi:hypothetical protein